MLGGTDIAMELSVSEFINDHMSFAWIAGSDLWAEALRFTSTSDG